MKNIFVLLYFFSATIFAQDYSKEWNKVLLLESDGKIKSASLEVEKIYKKASQSKEEAQILKCFLYQSKYIQKLEEDAQVKIVKNLERQIIKVSIPSQSILNYIYAKSLRDYSAKHQYTIKNTVIDSVAPRDFKTWTKSDFNEQVDKAYKATLSNESILQATSIQKYEPIFDFIASEENQNSTLYDFIIGENILYYTNNLIENAISNKDFDSHTSSLYGDAHAFTTIDFSFVKYANLKTILTLYQKREQQNPSLQNRFERIRFCQKYLLKTWDNYLQAISSLQSQSTNIMLQQKILLEKAVYYSEQASKAQHPDYNEKAINVLDSVLAFNNRSNSYKLAFQKKRAIESKQLNVTCEKYIGSNQKSRMLVTYKNVDSIAISFYKISPLLFKSHLKRTPNNDSLINALRAKKPFKQQSFPLIGKKDYFRYTTEILMPELETGTYLMYFEGSDIESARSYEIITVSDLSAVANSKEKTIFYHVLNRKTGQPIEKAVVNSDQFNLITNDKGVANFDFKTDDRFNPNIILIKDKDSLVIEKNYISSHSDNYESDYYDAKVNFYLDRAIYRPGQTVFYKGIAFSEKNNNEKSVITNTNFKISILNPEDYLLTEFDVTINEFGSFSGEYTIPTSGLTGDFSIVAEEPDDYEKDAIYDVKTKKHPFWDFINLRNSEMTFRVEEYKRPRFEVTFKPVTENITFGSKISVDGTAKAFSGSNITDAKVSYTITMQTYLKGYYGATDGVLEGQTTTDANGNFSIPLTIKLPENIDIDKNPIISYQISADITDNNGETRSSQTVVRAGRQAFTLSADMKQILDPDTKNSALLSSTTLNGQFVAVNGAVSIYFLKSYEDRFMPRKWEKPEITGISDEDFARLFPYEKNDFPSESPDPKLVWSGKVDTGASKTLSLDFLKKFTPGYYSMTFSATDEWNNAIEKTVDFQLAISKSKEDPNHLFTAKLLNANPKKDGYADIQLLSVIPKLHIITTASTHNSVFYEKGISLNNHKATVRIPLNKHAEGTISVGLTSIFENTVYNIPFTFELLKETRSLTFQTESFRSKIEPGSQENWSFRLAPKSNYNESEMLASMYDRSLDQFATDYWENLEIARYHNSEASFMSDLGFGASNVNFKFTKTHFQNMELKSEKLDLIWFGFDFNDPNSFSKQKEYRNQVTKKIKKPANSKLISGIISDSEGTLPGAIVTVNGTLRTVQSDIEGFYEIDAAPGEVLTFSFIGLETESILITNKTNLNVQLVNSPGMLENVVVDGYAFARKSYSLSMSTSRIVENSDTSLLHTLEGRVAGINVVNNAGTMSVILRGVSSVKGNDNNVLVVVDGVPMNIANLQDITNDEAVSVTILKGAEATSLYGSRSTNGVLVITTKKAIQELSQVKARTNLSETAFFLPHLKTDSKGLISLNFTSPEALTLWKFRLFGHDKNATTGYFETNVVTQKDIMITPNFPRFFREKDTITVSAKISNITTEAKSGMAVLQLFDAINMKPIDVETMNQNAIKSFDIPAMGNISVSWTIAIPMGLQGIQYKVLAKSGNFSDGEENILPVLTNYILVTESIPIWVRENSKKEYVFENLKNNNSKTLKNHQLTSEYTSNPTWLAIQSLQYLIEYEHDCAEQTFAKLYANSLALEIINSNPKIAEVFDEWRKSEKPISKLEQNPELKSLLIAETPWLADAQDEEQKKKNLALLLDVDKMKIIQDQMFEKLIKKQNPSGGFPWFEGGNENEFITRHILAGFGHLQKLGVQSIAKESASKITKPGISFIDAKHIERHKSASSNGTNRWISLHPYSNLHYLYTRSFYLTDYPLPESLKRTVNDELQHIKTNWLEYSLYEKGMAALVLNRFGESAIAKKILISLKETASLNDDWGMYWIENKAGWYWNQAPIETQALLIEAFCEIANDTKSADAMKVWLLKKKQTKNWPTTKATTEAIYALILHGTDWMSVKDNTVMKIGNEEIVSGKMLKNEKETASGYYKINWKESEINKEMSAISIENKSKVPGFGGIYWQYFEDLDNIKKGSSEALSATKELYLKKNNEKGAILQKIDSANMPVIGDLVTVRIIVKTTEDVEYIHLKDMRASCFEPIDVLSSYQWKDGLGFYKSTKDAATHFFFDRINSGTYVLEYDLRVNNSGNFSNGITTIESMYAPEFSSHTKGIRVDISK